MNGSGGRSPTPNIGVARPTRPLFLITDFIDISRLVRTLDLHHLRVSSFLVPIPYARVRGNCRQMVPFRVDLAIPLRWPPGEKKYPPNE